ncbi:MAG TPA: sugar ABC transporter permease [Chloroflexi bacterium]|nr:sugar ABC transporter permease [Chloroflexota bacterium]
MKRLGFLPWLYIGPALLLLGFFLVYPALDTFRLSFFGARSEEFVGIGNYVYAFTTDEMLTAFKNNAIWLVLFTFFTVFGGLVIAVLLDRVRYEALAKAVIFLPQAISFVGAGVIWKFVYDYRPGVGLLNAILVRIFPDMNPIGWLVNSNISTYALIATGIWIWTGFAMTILSAAVKGVPDEIMEAARIDGANEWQIFWRVTIPMISATIAVVATTMVINVLKVFDLVYVMTAGRYDTNVIANQMYKELYINRQNGRASAIAVVLLLAIVPVMLINIQRFQEQEARR